MGIYDDVYVALEQAGVRFVVVGGTAVVLQGHARLTIDLDLVIDLDPGPASGAVRALTELGLQPRLPVDPLDFADPEIRGNWIEHRNLLVFSFFDPATPRREVDLFAVEPLPFEELHDQASVVDVAGVAVRVASRRHLIAMKRQAGRPRDLEDIAVLESLDDA